MSTTALKLSFSLLAALLTAPLSLSAQLPIHDDFNDGTIDPTIWGAEEVNSGIATYVEQSGRLELEVTGSGDAALPSIRTFNFGTSWTAEYTIFPEAANSNQLGVIFLNNYNQQTQASDGEIYYGYAYDADEATYVRSYVVSVEATENPSPDPLMYSESMSSTSLGLRLQYDQPSRQLTLFYKTVNGSWQQEVFGD